MTFSRAFLTITVNDNHIEINDGMWPWAKHLILPMSNITTVSVSKFTKSLEIYTNNGKKYTYSFGSEGKNLACLEAIVSNL